MSDFDGQVVINTAISDAGLKEGGVQIEKAVKNVLKSVDRLGNAVRISMERQAASVMKANKAYRDQEAVVEKLRSELEKAGSTRIESDEFREIGRQIEADEIKLNRLIDAQNLFISAGGNTSGTAYKRRQLEIEELRNSIRHAKSEQEELLKNGEAYVSPDVSGLTEKLNIAEDKLANLRNALNLSFDTLKSKSEQAGDSGVSSADRIKNAFRNAGGAVNSVGGIMVSSIRKSTGAFGKLKEKASEAFKRIRSESGKSIKQMLKYAFGIRSLFVLFNRLRNWGSAAFKVLAADSDEVNDHLSQIKSGFSQFKNSIATAFQPIVQAITPFVTQILDVFTQANTAIGTFFAALTGQEYIYKATKQNEKYAESAEDLAKAQKEANSSLAAYDKLDVISKHDESTESTSAFEKVAVGGGIQDIADRIKAAWEEADFSGIGEAVGDKINKELQGIKWGKIKKTCKTVATSIATFINGFISTPELGTNIGSTIAELINTGVDTVSDFFDTVEWDKVGAFIGDGVNGFKDKFDSNKLGRTIAKAINSGVTTIKSFFNTVEWSELGSFFADGINGFNSDFDSKNLGETIAKAINSGVELIHGFASKVKWDNIGKFISDGIDGFFDELHTKELGETISTVILGAIQAIETFLDETDFENVGAGLSNTLMGVKWKEIAGGIATIFFKAIKAGFEILKGFIGNDSEFALKVGAVLAAIFAIKSVIGAIGGGLASAITGAAGEAAVATAAEGAGLLIGGIIAAAIVGAILGIELAKHANEISEAASNISARMEWALYDAGILKEMSPDAQKRRLEAKYGKEWEVQDAEWKDDALASKYEEYLATGNANEYKLSFGDWKNQYLAEEQKSLEEQYDKLIETAETKGKIYREVLTSNNQLAINLAQQELKSAENELKAFVEEHPGFTLPASTHEKAPSLKEKEPETPDTWNVSIGAQKDPEFDSNLKSMHDDIANKVANGDWKAVINALKNSAFGTNLKGMTTSIGNVAKDTWKAVVGVFKGGKFDSNIGGMKTGIGGVAKTWSASVGVSKNAKFSSNLADMNTSISKVAKTTWKALINTVKSSSFANNLSSMGTAIKGIAKDSWKALVGTKKASGFDKNLSSMSSSIGGIATTWKALINAKKASGFDNNLSTIGSSIANLTKTQTISIKASAWSSVKGSFETLVNSAKDFINKNLIDKLNALSLGTAEEGSAIVAGTKAANSKIFAVPKLATGAVIPPNREFLAVLGDQKHGTNIETPLSTMIEAFETALNRMNTKTESHPTVELILNRKVIAEAVWEEERKKYGQVKK